jgi:RNA polymerase sigma-70 factor, ECF subfamily
MRRQGKEAARRQAFEVMTSPHLGALYRFAVYRVRDAGQAEDLVQEACLKAFQAFDRFERGTDYKAWLFRILLNTITDFQRKIARELNEADRQQPNAHITFLDGVERSCRLDPEQQLLAGSLTAAVQAAVKRLPPDWQSVVLLNFGEELRYQEIADLLGIPLGTVMSRLYRARQFLRQHLAHYLVDDDDHARPRAPSQGGAVTFLDAVRRRSRTQFTQEAE